MTTKKVPGLTDMGNAQQLSNLCGDDTRFIVDADRWYAYEKPVWIAGSDRAIYRTTTQVTGYWAQEAALEPDENKSKQIWKHMLRSEGAKSKYNMIQLASKLENLCARSSDFDSSPYLLNIKSGVMDLRTQKITPHAPSDMMMKLAPLTYVAGAKAPMWETFLARVQPNEEHRKCLQRFAGYWFTGLASEQVMLFMDGTGANGKSTFVNAIMAMLGSYAIVCPDNLLLATKSNEHPTGLADLQGSRFVSKMEIDKGKSFNEAMIKRLTGGERLKARWMRQDFFEFQPTHKICVGANHRPIIKGNDKGIWRRIPVIPFREEIPMDERVVDYENVMLRAEGPGIFNWVLEGLADFMNGGLQIPKSMWKETESYKLQMDVLGPFFEEACLLQEDTAPGTKIQVEQRVLYQAYVRWLKELSGKPCGYRHFNRLMRERNYENIVGWYRGKTRRVWKGIDILPLFDWGMEHPDLGSVVHTGHDALSEA
jgi:putative DNA primase/helicase